MIIDILLSETPEPRQGWHERLLQCPYLVTFLSKKEPGLCIVGSLKFNIIRLKNGASYKSNIATPEGVQMIDPMIFL